jgi:hypothetical protein
MRKASHDLVQKSHSIFSWLNTEMARPASGIAKTGSTSFPNWTIRFPWIRPKHLRQEAHPATNPKHCHDKIQEVGIVINRSIIRCLTSWLGHQCLSRGGLRRWCIHLVHLGRGGTVHKLCHQCTSTRNGQDLPKVLATEATTQGTAVMGVLSTNKTERLKDRKIRQSRMPNWTIQFLWRQQQPLVSSTSSGCPKSYLLLMD